MDWRGLSKRKEEPIGGFLFSISSGFPLKNSIALLINIHCVSLNQIFQKLINTLFNKTAIYLCTQCYYRSLYHNFNPILLRRRWSNPSSTFLWSHHYIGEQQKSLDLEITPASEKALNFNEGPCADIKTYRIQKHILDINALKESWPVARIKTF